MKRQNSVFKPVVATSLALALGVSVAVANPTITTDTNTDNISSSLGITWENATNGGFSPSFASATSATRFIISFDPSATSNTTAIESNGGVYVVKIANSSSSVTLTSTQTLDMTGKSIELRPSKNGSVNGKSTTLDLSRITSGYALIGDFKTGGGAGNTNIGKFGGSGIQGNVTLDGSASTEMYFTGSAGITGTLSITQNGTNTFSFENGTIGGATTISNGQNTFKLQSSSTDGATINSLFANTVSLSGGSLIFTFASNTEANNKIFNFNTTKQIGSANQFSITRGTLVFDSAKKVYFNDGDTPNQGNGTLSLSGGAVKFVVDPTITTAGDQDQAIAKGNISATGASVIFALSSADNNAGSNPFTTPNANPPSDIYYVDGDLTINNGGISSFWDDSKGFVGKIAVTSGHTMSITGNLIGKNDAWFESGSFTAGNNTINTIQSTTGDSHLVFEDAMIIGTAGSTPAIRSNGGANMIMFKNSATINNNILTTNSQNSLYFKGDATINGNILSQPGYQGHNNLLVFTGSSATIGSSDNASSIEITNGAGGRKRYSNNTLMFSNSTTSTLNLSKIHVVGDWSGVISAMSQRNFNALSFNGATNNVTIGSISSSFATNLIAKDFYLDSGYNPELFDSNIPAMKSEITAEFVKSKYSASGNFTIGSISVGKGAANYLNLTGTTKIIGDITSRLNEVNGTGHNNLLVFTGTSSALGDNEHKISISVNNTSNPAGGKYSNNTLLLGATTNTLNLSSLSVSGDYGGGSGKTFNALSFNSTSDNGSSSIGSISAAFGFNIIGKNLITQDGVDGSGSGYNTALFSANGSNPSLIGGFFTEFIKSKYAVQGTFVIGDNTSGVVDAITTGQGGNNYLNLTGNTTIKGNILSSVTAQNGTGHNNLLVLTGNSATLGESSKEISIGVYNPSGQTGGAKYSNNTLLLGATTNTLNVSSLSVTGDIGAPAPNFNALSFNGTSNTANIASISAVYGFNIIGKDLITQGGVDGSGSGYNTSLFNTTNSSNPSLKTGFATEFLKSDYAVQGTFVIGDNASGVIDAITTGQSGTNYLNFKGSTTIKGNILSSVTTANGTGHNNLLVLTGASATLGESGKAISISVSNSTVGGQKYSNNTLLLGATTNTLNVSNISVSGDYGNGAQNKTFNALSFNSDNDTGSKNIASMSAGYGFNIIGKNLITQGDITRTTGGYNASLFDTTNSSNPSLASGFFTEFIKSNYAVSGTFVFGSDNSSNAFNTGLSGQNYVNINGNTTFKGNILSSVSSASGNTGGHNNIIVLTGTSATLGESNNAISIKIANTGGSYGYYSTNTLLLGATTNTLNLSELSVSANWVINSDKNKNFNALSFNSSSNTGNIASVTASYGSNIIGKDLITQNSGYDTRLFANSAMQGSFATSFMSSTYTAQGSLTFGSIISNDGGTNYINVNSFTISTLTANGGSNDIGFNANSQVLENISKSGGANNFTYLADSISLTLQGENSAISTLTALNSATSGDTLILDATNNDSVVASVDTVASGTALKVDFKGINDTKSTQLTLDTTRNQNLKNVSVTSGTNNTLVLSGTGTMTIADAVTIGDTSGEVSKGVTFDLTSGSNLTFTSGLTTQTQGVVSFDLGSTNILSGTFANSGINNFNITKTGTTTFKYATGTNGLTFTSGENNINFLAENSTLNWQKNDGSGAYSNIDIVTNGSGATTNLNFFESGTLASGISTTAGTTNINIYNQKSATISSAIATTSGATNVVFKSPVQREEQVTYSTLTLGGTSNELTSVTSEANAQAKIALNGTNGATIGTTTINENATLLFAFTGSGDSTVTATDGITVGNGATLGISLGGSGEKKVLAGTSANITFDKGSTLLVDFQDRNTANGTIGNGTAFTITEGSKSIINFHGENSGKLNAQSGDNNSIIVNGGENTVNFMGGKTAVFAGVTLTSGKNTINVYGASDTNNGIIGTVITSDVGNVSNIINLNDYATLNLKNAVGGTNGDGSLTSTGSNNASELNFIGTGATLQGGFGATSATEGSATITVGSADKAEVSGIITGVVSNSDLKFKAGNSKLTLQGATNTLKSLTTDATNGELVLDTTLNSIDTTITAPITIKQNTSLTFGLYSDNTNNNYAKVSVGGLKVQSGGTLGIAIGGSGTGTREVKITGGSDNYANMFDVGSTLRIDFLQDANGSAKLGNGQPIVISSGRKSQINFYGGSGNPSLEGGITLNGGSNEVNFYGNATLTGITLTSGDNTIRIKGDDTGITGTVGVSSVGSVRNTVELEKNATLSLVGAENSVGTLSNASVNVLGTSTKIAGTITDASITFTSADADLTLQAGDSTITSLTTNYTTPSSYTRNGRIIARAGGNTLTLDDAVNTNPISATITSAVTSNSVGLKFGDGSEAKTFTFSASGNYLTSVAFGTESKNNTLEFSNGDSTLENASVSANNELTIKLGNANLTLTSGYNSASGGVANLSVAGEASVSGGTISANTLTFANNTSLSVSNTGTNTFTSVDVSSNAGTLIANDSALIITALTGDKLTAGFSGNGTSSVKIVNDNDLTGSIILAGVVLNGATSDNTLDLTALTSTTITNNVSVGANQSLAINLGGTNATLRFSDGLSNSGSATINANATDSNTIAGSPIALSNLNLGGATNTTTLTASEVSINALNANATTSSKLILDASSNAVLTTIDSISGNNLTLSLKGTSEQNSATLQFNGVSSDNRAVNGIATLNFETDSSNNKVILNGDLTIANKVTDSTSATFDLNSSALTLSGGMDVTGKTTTFNLSGTSAINGALTLNGGNIDMNLSGNSTFTLANNPTKSGTGNFNFAFKGSNATLNVDANKLSLDTLTSNGSNTINLVTEGRDTTTSNTTFKLLDIGSMNGGSVKTTLFVNKDTANISNQTLGGDSASNETDTYGYAHSDRVIVNGGSNSSNLVLSVVPNLDQLLDLTYSGNNGTGDSGNIALATIKKDSGVQVSSESVTIGFDVVEAQLQKIQTDVNGNENDKGDYFTYFLGGAVSKGASVETQEVAQSALAVSYDLYLANFNSLNKRMGELRDNNHDNGVWARVYGGAMSNDFGAGSKTQYVTTQAGYDYSLSVGDNARNYIGIAVAYGHSNTQSNTLTQKGSVFGSTQTIGLDKVSSDMVEVGLYNSYVADSGWYNDTIFKFDYIMSEFALSNDLSKMTKTNNFAMILSDEFGYRYSFGVSEKGSWYIDPQAEVGFGWFNQSDFNRSLESSLGTSTLKASQDAILTLRTRVGASLGKKFNTDKGFASIYVGAFYEYDYIEGGNTEVTSANSSSATTNNFLQQIESNGRVILNVGSNIELTKGARLYIDVEKSFGDKQRTFMQFNLGARYSF